MISRTPLILCVTCLILQSILENSAWAEKNPKDVGNDRSDSDFISKSELSVEELQFVLRANITSYYADISRVCEEVSEHLESKRAKARLQRWKLDTISSSVRIAIGVNPYINLLDFLVLVSLEKDAVSRHWSPNEFEGLGSPIMDELTQYEETTWILFRRIFKDTDLEPEILALIQSWQESNSDNWSVSSISFEQFAAARGVDPTLAPQKSGGFLGSLKKTTIALDQARSLAERQAFVIQTMPGIVSEQTRLLFLEASASEDAELLRKNSNEILYTSSQLLNELEEMRFLVEDMRSETLEDLDDLLTSQRADSIEEVSSFVQSERSSTIESLQAVSKAEREETAKVISELLANERRLTIEEVSNAIAKERTASLDGAHGILDRVIGQDNDASFGNLLDKLFRLGIVTNALLVLSIVVIVLARTSRKNSDEAKKP